ERVKEYQSDENELWNDRERKDKKEKKAEEKDLNGEKSVTRQKTGKQKEGIFRRIGKGFRKLLKKFR
ncbi:MAG: hypothetical protein V5A47_11935, partial [Bacteroidales bacterium]